MTPDSVSLAPGKSSLLTAIVLPENATEQTVIWSSDDAEVATVDANGNVTAVVVGTTKITATSAADETIFDTTTVRVDIALVSATEVLVTPDSLSLAAGNTASISASVLPDTAGNKNVVWSSNNFSVATVDQNGEITAVTDGTALITAASENNAQLTDTCQVTVIGGSTSTDTVPPVITLTGGNVTQTVGEPYTDQGATAEDDIDGNLTPKIVVDEMAVTIDEPGTYNVTYNVSDAAGNPAVQVVRKVTVEPEPVKNEPPVANKDSYTIENKQQAFDVPVLKNDTDPDTPLDELRILTVGELQPAESGTLVFDENTQTITYTPAQDFEGLAGFAYIINDGNAGNDAPSEASIVVNLGNGPVPEVQVTPSNLSLEQGNNGTLTATLTPAPPNPGPQNVRWSSDNPEIATVDANGTVTAVAVGTTIISASYSEGDFATLDTAEITVSAGPANQAPLAVDDAATVKQGETVSIDVLANDTDPDTPMAQVNITAVGAVQPEGAGAVTLNGRQVEFTAAIGFEGAAIFTYSIRDDVPINDATAKVTVDVQAAADILVSGITVTSTRKIIQNNETEQFFAEIVPADATNQNVVWSSNDPKVATVDANTGLVTGVSEGTASIEASAADDSSATGSTSIKVTRTEVLVDGITISGDKIIQDDDQVTFDAIITPVDATNQVVVWSSSDPSIASVEANTGIVMGVSQGNVTITATAVDASSTEGSLSILVTSTKSGENDITAFVYPNQSDNAIIDNANHTISIGVFSGADLTVAPQNVQISAGATINPLGTIGRDFTSPVTYTVTAENGDQQNWEVTITNDLDNTKEITLFTINGVSVKPKGTNIDMTLPANTNLTALTPIIEFTGSSVFPPSGEQRDFSNPIDYLVTADNGTIVTYRVTITHEPVTQPSFTFDVLGPVGQVDPGQSSQLTFNIEPNPTAVDQNIKFSMRYSVNITRQTEFTYNSTVNIAGAEFTVNPGTTNGSFIGNVLPCEPVSVTFTVTNNLGLPSQSKTILIDYGSGGNPCP